MIVMPDEESSGVLKKAISLGNKIESDMDSQEVLEVMTDNSDGIIKWLDLSLAWFKHLGNFLNKRFNIKGDLIKVCKALFNDSNYLSKTAKQYDKNKNMEFSGGEVTLRNLNRSSPVGCLYNFDCDDINMDSIEEKDEAKAKECIENLRKLLEIYDEIIDGLGKYNSDKNAERKKTIGIFISIFIDSQNIAKQDIKVLQDLILAIKVLEEAKKNVRARGKKRNDKTKNTEESESH